MDTGLGRHGVGMATGAAVPQRRRAARPYRDLALRAGGSAYLALLVIQYLPEGRDALADAVMRCLPGEAGDLVALLVWLGLLPVFALAPFARRGQRRAVRWLGLLLVAVNALAEALRNLTLGFPHGQWLSNLDSAWWNAVVGLVAGGLLFALFRVLARVRLQWSRHRRA